MVDHVPQMYLMQKVVAEQIEDFERVPAAAEAGIVQPRRGAGAGQRPAAPDGDRWRAQRRARRQPEDATIDHSPGGQRPRSKQGRPAVTEKARSASIDALLATRERSASTSGMSS